MGFWGRIASWAWLSDQAEVRVSLAVLRGFLSSPSFPHLWHAKRPTVQERIRSLPEVRRRVPDLPFLGDFGESTRNQVGKLLEHYQTEEKDRATEHYKSLIQHDEAKLRTFVKNRADMQLDWEKEPPPPDQVRLSNKPSLGFRRATCSSSFAG